MKMWLVHFLHIPLNMVLFMEKLKKEYQTLQS